MISPRFINVLVGRRLFQTTVRNMAKSGFEQIPEVSIDPIGRFKYILMDVKSPDGYEKFIVRGFAKCAYHADIVDLTDEELRKANCKGLCVGGGRIEIDPEDKSIQVYGYSQGYGRANHEMTADVLRMKYHEWNVTWTNDGY